MMNQVSFDKKSLAEDLVVMLPKYFFCSADKLSFAQVLLCERYVLLAGGQRVCLMILSKATCFSWHVDF